MADDQKDAAVPRWREDFPVRWDDDHYLTRRELAKFLTLGSALLAGASGLLAVAGTRADTQTWPDSVIAGASGLLPGTSLLFRYPTEADPCILIKDGRGEVRAYSQVCTHLSCAVRYEAAGNTIACPCHKGLFAVEDGRPTGGPPTRPLPRIRLERREDGFHAVGVDV
jgi:nitrite reductase/ring-hydroxylating ferredoxin subunit